MDLSSQLTETLGAAYTLERELGGGGMSRVFVAHETRLKRRVVVKVLSPELAQGLNAQRFEREIELAASLQQANIVPLLNAGESGGLPFYTMPFVEGESLRARLERGPVAIAEATSVLRDVARALAYAHERGVVHRDIKPDNVLLSGGAAVVTDFGIAKALAAARGEAAATNGGAAPLTALTVVGTSIGTPAYMAPEQASGDPNVDHRADLYSFGCLAYELLAGRPPFTATSTQRLIVAHLTETPPSLAGLRPDAPPALVALVAGCLEKEPDARPQTAGEIVGLLDAASSQPSFSSAQSHFAGRRTLGKALAIYAATFVLVALAAWFAIGAIGLPDWVFPGALIVMALGLPAILFAGYAQRAAQHTPTNTMATLAVKASPHITWRRVALGGAYAIGAFALGVGAFMGLRAAGIGPAGSLLARGSIKTREPLLVADFTSRGDSSLGNVMTEAVRADLGQSKVVSLVAPAAVAAALQRMQRPASARFELTLAREMAQRDGIKGIVDGDITPLGTGYALSLRLVSADSGNVLTSFRTSVDKPSDLIDAINSLSRKLRGKIGESLKSVNGSPALAQVTTSSLDALRKFTEGSLANRRSDYSRAVVLFREAVAIDSTFTAAWIGLAAAAANGNGFSQSEIDHALSMSYRFRGRLDPTARLLTEARYFNGGPGRDRSRALQLYQRIFATDSSPPLANTIALIYVGIGEFARAESLYTWAIQRDSNFTLAHGNIVGPQFDGGKFAAAESSVALARRRHPGYLTGVLLAAVLRYHKGDLAVYRRALDSLRTAKAPRLRITGGYYLADLDLINGRLRDAERVLAETRTIDAQNGREVPPIVDSIALARNDAWFLEQRDRATKRLDAALAAHPLKTLPVVDRPYFALASAYALAGHPDRARAVLREFESEADTTLRRGRTPDTEVALADIALAENKPKDALAHLARAGGESMDRDRLGKEHESDYARAGFAYDMEQNADSAIASFTKFLSTPALHRIIGPNDPLYLAATYKRLGELYEAKGDAKNAATYYTKFVDLWKNADPELQPKVAEVKKRLARLDTERR